MNWVPQDLRGWCSMVSVALLVSAVMEFMEFLAVAILMEVIKELVTRAVMRVSIVYL